jgi:hypothetical protein
LARSPKEVSIRVRYYIWDGAVLLRLAGKLHHALLDRTAAIIRFAGSRQKLIEVIARSSNARLQKFTITGTILTFDAAGYLEWRPAIKAALEGFGTQPRFEWGITDLQKILRERNFELKFRWMVPEEVVSRIKPDFGIEDSAFYSKIQWLKPE